MHPTLREGEDADADADLDQNGCDPSHRSNRAACFGHRTLPIVPDESSTGPPVRISSAFFVMRRVVAPALAPFGGKEP